MRFYALLLLMLLLCSQALAADKLGVAIPYALAKVDPLVLDEPLNRIVLANISVGLTRLGKDGDFELETADYLKSQEQGARWVAKIAAEARFPSQRLLTAERAKQAIEYLIALKPEAPVENPLQSRLKNLASIEISRPASQTYRQEQASLQMTFTLKEKDSRFPLSLSLIPLVDIPVAQAFGAEFGFGTNSAYLGPYQIRENRAEKGVLLEKVPEYFHPGLPKTPFVDFHLFGDAQEALRTLRVGGVDIIAFPTPAQLEDIKDDPTLLALPSPLLNMEPLLGPWKLLKTHWSDRADDADVLTTDKVIVRKSLQLDESFQARFCLSGSFLP